MPYLYLIGAVGFVSSANIFASFYNRKHGDKTGLYNLVYAIVVWLIWTVLYAFDFSFDARVLWYALGFGVSYAVGVVGLVYALKGPVTITSLFVQTSLIGTTVWGFIFWDAKFTAPVGVGLVLVFISLFLCLYKGEQKEGEENKFSWGWLLSAVCAFVGNAGCTIIQRSQQTAFDGRHGNMLMSFATLVSLAVCVALYLYGDKTEHKRVLRSPSIAYPIAGGVSNLLLNVCVMKLATSVLSPSLVYPVIAVGGLAIVTLFSLFVFKEKMKWWQWLGIAVGALAVGLLSI
ncbi:MAG: hypothetical protein IJB34_05935 [Clostridia bacterium]|nr:hypothetical protein [Clostridia bacterium]